MPARSSAYLGFSSGSCSGSGSGTVFYPLRRVVFIRLLLWVLMPLHRSDSPGAARSSSGRKLPLKVRICGRKEKGGDGPEDSTEGGESSERRRAGSEPDLPEGNPTAAALKFNLRRQTVSAAPSRTAPACLTRKRSSELEAAGEGGVYYTDTERAPSDKTGGSEPAWMCCHPGPQLNPP